MVFLRGPRSGDCASASSWCGRKTSEPTSSLSATHSSLAPGLEWTRMFWLVNANFPAARKHEGSKFSPTLFSHVRDLHFFRFEVLQSRRDVIAHEVKLTLIVLVGIMEGGFEWRHGKN